MTTKQVTRMYSHHCGPKVGIEILADLWSPPRLFAKIQKKFFLAFVGCRYFLSCGCMTALLRLGVVCNPLPGAWDLPLHFSSKTVSAGERCQIITDDLSTKFFTKSSLQGSFPNNITVRCYALCTCMYLWGKHSSLMFFKAISSSHLRSQTVCRWPLTHVLSY